ncbi:putative phage abortive infection protein [Flagellimonas sp.]|uniref:putative phage abortive infection protein n=1 Tax=Flagellimonas sp. TaxID=2058762 RepID=UPI003B523B4A
MIRRTITFLAWAFIIIGCITIVFFLFKSSHEGFSAALNEATNYTVSGQFGDFIGGVVGTLFALAGTLLIFLTFREQANQNSRNEIENRRNSFERNFFQMLNIHRANVGELTYKKHRKGKENTYEKRQVIKVIFDEFTDCYREVTKFSSSEDIKDYCNPDYQGKLMGIVARINPSISLVEMARIDIAYLVMFYGLGEEGEVVLRENFKKKYKPEYYFRLLFFLKMKPKKSNHDRYQKWKEVREMPLPELSVLIDVLYPDRNNLKKVDPKTYAGGLKLHLFYEKYYGGHQFRLGHYFRHLYQSYKYLNNRVDICDHEKYAYGKTFRAQLSTYEQALIFVNSLSTIGMRWEYFPEETVNERVRTDLITFYNLIKNLPGEHIYGIKYDTYYPNVDYESREQLFQE